MYFPECCEIEVKRLFLPSTLAALHRHPLRTLRLGHMVASSLQELAVLLEKFPAPTMLSLACMQLWRDGKYGYKQTVLRKNKVCDSFFQILQR